MVFRAGKTPKTKSSMSLRVKPRHQDFARVNPHRFSGANDDRAESSPGGAPRRLPSDPSGGATVISLQILIRVNIDYSPPHKTTGVDYGGFAAASRFPRGEQRRGKGVGVWGRELGSLVPPPWEYRILALSPRIFSHLVISSHLVHRTRRLGLVDFRFKGQWLAASIPGRPSGPAPSSIRVDRALDRSPVTAFVLRPLEARTGGSQPI